MKTVLLAGIVWSLSSLLPAQFPSPDAWARADAATRRLDPSEFPDLSSPLRAELKRRRCVVPQTFTGRPAHNVIRGMFTTAGQVDWAVLCSRNRTSSILVFSRGDPRSVRELAERRDADFLVEVAPGQIGFSRAITVASPQYIREHHERYGGPTPPPLNHAGIDESFLEKASVVWYWYQGKWMRLQGSD